MVPSWYRSFESCQVSYLNMNLLCFPRYTIKSVTETLKFTLRKAHIADIDENLNVHICNDKFFLNIQAFDANLI